MLLTANPGYEKSEETKYYNNKPFVQENIEHFNFKQVFHKRNAEDYYSKKLKELITKYGDEKISKNISILEFFPYQSMKFKKTALLPSQEFGFEIVRYAINEGKVIVIMRSKKHWYDAVKELEEYKNIVILNSYLNPCITENNCHPGDFQKILNELNKAK
jgi:hypothetical protein